MRRPVALALLVALAGSAGCGDAPPGPRLTVEVSPTPATVGNAQVRVVLRDTVDASGASVALVTGRSEDAPDAPVADTATAVRPGLWVADDFPFPRRGSWVLEAEVRLPDGRVLRGRHEIRVVGGTR